MLYVLYQHASRRLLTVYFCPWSEDNLEPASPGSYTTGIGAAVAIMTMLPYSVIRNIYNYMVVEPFFAWFTSKTLFFCMNNQIFVAICFVCVDRFITFASAFGFSGGVERRVLWKISIADKRSTRSMPSSVRFVRRQAWVKIKRTVSCRQASVLPASIREKGVLEKTSVHSVVVLSRLRIYFYRRDIFTM